MAEEPVVVFGECHDCGMMVPWRCLYCHMYLLRPNEEHECPFGQQDGGVYALCAECEDELEEEDEVMDWVEGAEQDEEDEEDEGYESGLDSDQNQP